jgi:sarcosine oxidase subunit gamma
VSGWEPGGAAPTPPATLERLPARARFGCKGPRAAEWLAAQGIVPPARANTWTSSGAGEAELLVARLGTAEFFVEGPAESAVRSLATHPAGVYPVLREDCALALSGAACDHVLAQVCNVHFAALDPAARAVIMTLMVGVAVLVVPHADAGVANAAGMPNSDAGPRRYRIWCDPTFGDYLYETLRELVLESGGTATGVSA